MMAATTTTLADSGNRNTVTSIRMVPQSSQPETMAAGALVSLSQSEDDNSYEEDDEDEAPPPKKSITITRTLDIESVSVLTPTKSASMEPLATNDGYFADATSTGHHQIRSVNSVGSLLPSIPKMSAIDLSRPVLPPQAYSRPSTAPAAEQEQQFVVPQPPAPKLPPFMQSKRWARMCGGETGPTRPKSSAGCHERVISEEDRPMTLREASFEQQRAIWKHAVAMPAEKPPPVPVPEAGIISESREVVTLQQAMSQPQPQPKKQPSSSPIRPDDASSIAAHAQGLCRPLSLPTTWQLVRASRAGRASSQSAGNVFRKLTLHRSGTTKHHKRQGSIEKSAAANPNRMSRSSQLPRKRAVSDLRKRANPHRNRSRSPRRRNASSKAGHVVNLDFDSPRATQKLPPRPGSPVPSLHDPQKAKRFSEECEEMLSNSNFEKDFITPSVPVSRSPTDASKQAAPAAPATAAAAADTSASIAGPSKASNDKPKASKRQQQQQHRPPSPTTRPENSAPALKAPEPPERVSSKGAARLATVVSMTKPTCMPIINGFRDSAAAFAGDEGHTDSDEQSLPPQQSLIVPQNTMTRVPQRLASTASTVRTEIDSPRNTSAPRGAISTDTLMLIEAHMHHDKENQQQSSSLVSRLKQKTGLGKKLSNPGLPPERPLPDLPSEDASVSSKVKRGSKQSEHSAQASIHADDATGYMGPVSEPDAAGELMIKPLSIKLSHADITAGEKPQFSPTPSSIYSQASHLSELSTLSKPRYVRHDKSTFRADRIKDLKRRYKAEIGREPRRISEENEEDTDANDTDTPPVPSISKVIAASSAKPEIIKIYKGPEAPLPALPHLREQPSIDQLDQFPQVPVSRPGSRASESHHSVSATSKRTQSRARSHARQSSKASSRYSYRPAIPRMPTGASNTSAAASTTAVRQVLTTSQIRVLVDTNPLTGNFRAGAISPEPMSVSSSREGSPTKSLRSGTGSLVHGRIRTAYLPLPSRIDEDSDLYAAFDATEGASIRDRDHPLSKTGNKDRTASPPSKKTSIRSTQSRNSGGRRSAAGSHQSYRHYPRAQRPGAHRRMSFDTYTSLNSSPSESSSEDEAEAPLLSQSHSTSSCGPVAPPPSGNDSSATARASKKKKLRRRWNSNDIRTVQLLYEDLEEYYDQLMSQERELQRQQEETRRMVRVMAQMSKARGMKTGLEDEILIPGPANSTALSDHASVARQGSSAKSSGLTTTTSALGSPSRIVAARQNRGPYVHAHSASQSSSKAQLDAAAAELEAAMREHGHRTSTGEKSQRPMSNVSSASATTQESGMSTASSAKLEAGSGGKAAGEADGQGSRSKEGSMTDPREYDLEPEPVTPLRAAKQKGHVKAISASAASPAVDTNRPKSRGTLSMRSFRSSRKNKDVPASPVVNLHRPPPIPRTIKREVLSEEEDGFLSAASMGGSTPDLLSEVVSEGVVRKAGYLRLRGLSQTNLLNDVNKVGNARSSGELGVREVRDGLGLHDDDDTSRDAQGGNLHPPGSNGDDVTDDKRLSVNHVFTRTDAWDRMLETFA